MTQTLASQPGLLAQRIALLDRFADANLAQDLQPGDLVAAKRGLASFPDPAAALVLWRPLDKSDPQDAALAHAAMTAGTCSRPDCLVAYLGAGNEIRFHPAELAALRPLTFAEHDELLKGLGRLPADPAAPAGAPHGAKSPAFVHQVLPASDRWLAWLHPQGFVTVVAVLRLGAFETGFDVQTADGTTLRALPSQLRAIYPNLSSHGARP